MLADNMQVADDDLRTIWCGNLSDRVTEDILFELFMQGGPVQKVSIPKDHCGKQRPYGFVTYKHLSSVAYALDLFDSTILFDKPLHMKKRDVATNENPPAQNPLFNIDHMLALSQQMNLGNLNVGINFMPGQFPYMPFMALQPCNVQRVSRPHWRNERDERRPHNRESRRYNERDRSHRYSEYSHHDRQRSRRNDRR